MGCNNTIPVEQRCVLCTVRRWLMVLNGEKVCSVCMEVMAMRAALDNYFDPLTGRQLSPGEIAECNDKRFYPRGRMWRPAETDAQRRVREALQRELERRREGAEPCVQQDIAREVNASRYIVHRVASKMGITFRCGRASRKTRFLQGA